MPSSCENRQENSCLARKQRQINGGTSPWQKRKFLSAREQVSKQCYIHTVEYYSAVKMNELQKQAIICLSLDMLVGGRCVNKPQQT